MVEIKRILFPTDFSEHAAVATTYACDFADQFGANLHVLHVLPHLSTSLSPARMGPDLDRRISARRAELEVEAIEELAKVIDPKWQMGKSVTLATKEGPPYAEIVGYAKQHAIDLIVMGTHGRTGLPHFLIGSTAERVVRMAICPVLTIRPQGHRFERS